jgi:magnesium chelatase accessory protein
MTSPTSAALRWNLGFMGSPLSWSEHGAHWPHRDASSFVMAAQMHWHVQRMGQGPQMLLLHGTGAATHSWRGLIPLLAPHFSLTAVDLPGHGFTQAPASADFSMHGMAEALAALMAALDLTPQYIVGHSAGAALAMRMTLNGQAKPRKIVALNGALLPLSGVTGQVFASLARLLVLNPLVPRAFAWRAGQPKVLKRLVDATGSKIDDEGLRLYCLLAGNSTHAAAVLAMMASWDLWQLERELPQLDTPLVHLVGLNDRTISPDYARRVKALLPRSELIELPGLGHLAHEESPRLVSKILLQSCV